MLLVYFLLFAFCQLHTNANSKALADNVLTGNLQSNSEENLWDPSDMDTDFLNAQYDKLLENASKKPTETEQERKFVEALAWKPKNINRKRAYEEYLPYINEDDYAPAPKERRTNGARDARGDNFMRFGRSQHDDYMRFGRSAADDYMRFGRSAADDYMRFGRSAADDYMRFGRSPHDNYMRFGRDVGRDFLRFGKADTTRHSINDLLRTGRTSDKTENMDDISNIYLRYGRPENFMRFGRTAKSVEKDVSPDFMRFGRSVNSIHKTKILNKLEKKQQHLKP